MSVIRCCYFNFLLSQFFALDTFANITHYWIYYKEYHSTHFKVAPASANNLTIST
jgi:hypothetical protein